VGVVLLVLACIGEGETDCRYFLVSEAASMQQCVSGSQPAAAQWVGMHPNRRIAKILCIEPARAYSLLNEEPA
jgi:hypothetical protein